MGSRLSYYLFAPISTQRPDGDAARGRMRAICLNCHSTGHVERFYQRADETLRNTNAVVKEAQGIVDGLRAEGLIGKTQFATPLDFIAFDLWHYYGRTAKHGAYMGGADFSQWHGNYELQVKLSELRAAAAGLRARGGKP